MRTDKDWSIDFESLLQPFILFWWALRPQINSSMWLGVTHWVSLSLYWICVMYKCIALCIYNHYVISRLRDITLYNMHLIKSNFKLSAQEVVTVAYGSWLPTDVCSDLTEKLCDGCTWQVLFRNCQFTTVTCS